MVLGLASQCSNSLKTEDGNSLLLIPGFHTTLPQRLHYTVSALTLKSFGFLLSKKLMPNFTATTKFLMKVKLPRLLLIWQVESPKSMTLLNQKLNKLLKVVNSGRISENLTSKDMLLFVRMSLWKMMVASLLKDMVSKVFNLTKHTECSGWLIFLIFQICSLFTWEIPGAKAKVSGKALFVTKMRLGTIIKVLKNALTILSSLMETGGCVLKTGKLTTTPFMFVKFSQVLGLNSQLPVNGKETQMEVHTQTSIPPHKLRNKRRMQLNWTLVTAGSTTHNLDCQLQNVLKWLSHLCRKTSTSARDKLFQLTSL